MSIEVKKCHKEPLMKQNVQSVMKLQLFHSSLLQANQFTAKHAFPND